MPTLKQSLKAVYSPEEIKLLIIKDLRERGFANINGDDVQEPSDFETVQREARPYQFEGYEIRKDLPIPEPKPKITLRDQSMRGID